MKKLHIILIILACLLSPVQTSFAWDGVDSETGESVEIGKGNLVRRGLDIEVYDYSDGTYHDVEVQSIQRGFGSVDVEVYDYNTGMFRTFEMDE
jgi:hypothetical protein